MSRVAFVTECIRNGRYKKDFACSHY